MRFLNVTHFFASHGGGIERVAAQMCQNLAALGNDVVWAASNADPAPQGVAYRTLLLSCINPTEALTGLPMPIPGLLALYRLWCAIGRTDVVVVHDALYCTSIMAMVAARLQRKPVIMIQHIAEIAFSSPVLRLVMKLANNIVTRSMMYAADQVVFISQTVLDDFASYRKKQPPKLIFNGVDGSIFHAMPSARKRFGLPEKGRIVAFVGRFVEKKGLNVLRSLAENRPDLQFALAGSGPIDPLAWNLPNIHVLGRLSQQEVACLFATADLLLLPSVGEGYPLVIQEAMATGLPVVCGSESARADPAAHTWLRGVSIDLRKPGQTASQIGAAIDALKMSAGERRKMMDYAKTHYDWTLFAERIMDIGKNICNSHI
ncbi:glycosyltransferase family 4 protein [Komagataeibacter melomenusus]